MHEVPVVFIGLVLDTQVAHLEPFGGYLPSDHLEGVDHWCLLHGGGGAEVAAVETDVDGIGDARHSVCSGAIEAIAGIAEPAAGAVAAADCDIGIADVTAARIIVHRVCCAQPGCHARGGDGCLGHVLRLGGMVVDVDGLLAG